MATILIGNRIPKDFFITDGVGESDIQIHAGSYHLALKDAAIESYNIMTYSSILPGIAHELRTPPLLPHGAVVESIMAVAHATTGQRATAGIIFGWLYHKQTGERFGGLVCEQNGDFSIDTMSSSLHASLQELYTNGFSETYELRDIRLLTKTFTPTKKYGTALVALCFTSYEVPLLD